MCNTKKKMGLETTDISCCYLTLNMSPEPHFLIVVLLYFGSLAFLHLSGCTTSYPCHSSAHLRPVSDPQGFDKCEHCPHFLGKEQPTQLLQQFNSYSIRGYLPLLMSPP